MSRSFLLWLLAGNRRFVSLIVSCFLIGTGSVFYTSSAQIAHIVLDPQRSTTADLSTFPPLNRGFRRSLPLMSISGSEFMAEHFLGISKKQFAFHDPDEAPHWLVGSYYSIEGGLKATLMLNNKGILPLSVQPTLYSKNGQELELPPVVVEANSFRNIDLNDWIEIGGEDFREGNIRLFHTGQDLVLGAQIYLVDQQNSFSFEEKLAELGKFNSKRLDAIFAVPSKQSKVKVVLTNTSSDSINITGRLTRDSNIYDPQLTVLSPHETRILDLQKDFNGGSQALNGNAIGPKDSSAFIRGKTAECICSV